MKMGKSAGVDNVHFEKIFGRVWYEAVCVINITETSPYKSNPRFAPNI